MSRIYKLFFVLFLLFCIFSAVFAKSISEFNPDTESLIESAYSLHSNFASLSLFVFADIHGDKKALGRITEFLEKENQYIDDSICLGDMVRGSTKSDFSFWSKTKGAEKILLTLGNHDTLKTEGLEEYKKELREKGTYTSYLIYDYAIDSKDAYDRYYAPFIDNWNISSEKGKTYYYKDYRNSGIRLVVLRSTVRGKELEEQKEWYKKTLESAREKNMAVMVASHFTVCRNTENVPCDFSKPNAVFKAPEKFADFEKITQDFIDKGGEFICYLSGHHHTDAVLKNKLYPQYEFAVGTASVKKDKSDNIRSTKDKSIDLADIFVADRDAKKLYIIRVGADKTKNNTERKTLVFDYKNGKVLGSIK